MRKGSGAGGFEFISAPCFDKNCNIKFLIYFLKPTLQFFIAKERDAHTVVVVIVIIWYGNCLSRQPYTLR